jgi:hypothetical protein
MAVYLASLIGTNKSALSDSTREALNLAQEAVLGAYDDGENGAIDRAIQRLWVRTVGTSSAAGLVEMLNKYNSVLYTPDEPGQTLQAITQQPSPNQPQATLRMLFLMGNSRATIDHQTFGRCKCVCVGMCACFCVYVSHLFLRKTYTHTSLSPTPIFILVLAANRASRPCLNVLLCGHPLTYCKHLRLDSGALWPGNKSGNAESSDGQFQRMHTLMVPDNNDNSAQTADELEAEFAEMEVTFTPGK